MIWIDLAHRRPTDTDIPGWTAWSQAQWDAWLAKSQNLVNQLATLDAAGKRDERNALVDANSAHWGALKPWLQALSGGKCWFSEVRDLYSHYDVEHFRPKKEARASAGGDRDGYWWLAFDYMNFRLCGNVGNRKKGGWFPLREGSLCSTYANRCEESEAGYLLDPISSTDVALLAFNEAGEAMTMPDSTDWDQQRVRETIERLKLNAHPALTDERRKVWQRTSQLISDFLQAKSRCSGNNPAARAQLESAAQQIHASTRRDAELSAVARWCVLFRNDLRLARLLA